MHLRIFQIGRISLETMSMSLLIKSRPKRTGLVFHYFRSPMIGQVLLVTCHLSLVLPKKVMTDCFRRDMITLGSP